VTADAGGPDVTTTAGWPDESGRRRLTRRRAIAEMAAGTGALAAVLAGCGSSGPRAPAPSGSTLESTWSDPVGDGQLRVGPGEPLLQRTELGAASPPIATIGTLAHVTDSHVLDASSPARVTFLDRLGPPFQSTFRPQETLTAQVLSGASNAIRSLSPQLAIQGGDLIDNDQSNELEHALAVLRGGVVDPGSGPRGYYGVQLSGDTDPFYYRPAVDAPRYPQLLHDAVRRFQSRGVGAPVYPVLGDHDALVAGTLLPTALTRALAIGDRALWDLPRGLKIPPGLRSARTAAPDGPPDPGAVDELLAQALHGPVVRVPADPERRELPFGEVLSRLRAAGGAATAIRAGTRLDYVVDVGSRLRIVVLDVVRRDGGSGGSVASSQPAWLERRLADAGDRWVIVVTHQPIATSVGGAGLLAVMDRAPRVIAALNGHIHRNEIRPRPTAAGGYWLITTASLIDYPQQARALTVETTQDGAVAIRTWMLDHVDEPLWLGRISRQLAYLDAQGGRPQRFIGSPGDRNVILHRRAVA
jgi:3',5'-cyclic AMP phosphodiesterase CpdA